MDFTIPSHVQEIVQQITEFVNHELIPLEVEFLGKEWSDIEPHLRKLRQQVKEQGLWCPQIDKAHGGMGLRVVEFGLVSEALGRSPSLQYHLETPDPKV